MSLRSCIVVGSGPNGLAAAVTLARAGCRVTILEAEPTIGGGTRSGELTLPGFIHDTCSAIHPLGVASPFFRRLPLHEFGLDWIHPVAPLAHPFDDGSAATLYRSVDDTAVGLGDDAAAYRALIYPMMRDRELLLDGLLAPLLPPRHPLVMGRFGWNGMRSARGLVERVFRGERARALLAGICAHSVQPLEARFSASFGLVLAMLGHASGWPLPRGGSQAIARALADYFKSFGGEIVTEHRVTSSHELRNADAVFFDVAPKGLVEIGGDLLPVRYRRRLEAYRQAPAAFKLDWALDGPIPWRAPECAQAATVHLGGTMEEISQSEQAPARGDVANRPLVLLTQSSLFDDTRAPKGKHTAWAYCHIPNGSKIDATERIESQVERFAPGFRARILARHVMTPVEMEHRNANYIGGDVVGGANDAWQVLARPILKWNPYAVPVKGWYLCSASTPPGGGVHGMSGYHAAMSALRDGL